MSKRRRTLNFIKAKMYNNSNECDIVTPIDEQTGEEIDNVISCSVDSSADESTRLTIKVYIHGKNMERNNMDRATSERFIIENSRLRRE